MFVVVNGTLPCDSIFMLACTGFSLEDVLLNGTLRLSA
jgi:hypothetical protein